MATLFSQCPQCGYVHATTADRLACDARHGRRWPNYEIRDPEVICALCGIGDRLSFILDHMQFTESHRDVRTGVLIRAIEDTPDIASY